MNSIMTAAADSSVLFAFLDTMGGPDFLLLYAVWFFLTFGTVLILRWRGKGGALATLGGVAAFELPGLARWGVGSANGMHEWGFLFLMMIVGGILFLLRFESRGGSGGTHHQGEGP